MRTALPCPRAPAARRSCSGARLAAAVTVALAATVLLLSLGCSQPSTPEPGVPRQKAISRATELAKRSVPEQEMRDARIDAVTAEIITLGDANQRLGLQGPEEFGRGRGSRSLVWWVSVRGSFTYAGMAPAGGRAAVYQAPERDIIYDANSGALIGDALPQSQRLSPAVLPTPSVMPGTGP